MSEPLVGIIMGSRSDWETMRHAAETLSGLGIAHETKVVSAHRTPERLYEYARSAKERGLKVIIAGAGGAAHLPGMAASMTCLPVLGVPVESQALKGMDSLLSIVQMPAGIPVGTLAIGKAGATNAGLLAAAILANSDEGLAARLQAFRDNQTEAVANARMIPPGSTIGIIGGGQLGRMLSVAAAQLGYKCHIFAPDADPPAGDVAAMVTRADFTDRGALRAFADAVDVATYEFENLPACSLAILGDKLLPGTASLEIAQDRGVEKRFIEAQGARVAPWRAIDSEGDLRAAEADLRLPLVLKSRRLGYDGKGQAWVRETGSALAAWDSIGREPAVAEAAVEFEAEFSIILARTRSGETCVWDAPLNHHDGGILRRSTVPAGDPVNGLAEEASGIAARLAEALDHVGVLTVEYFATPEGPIVNEIAPRVHNSGHWTIEGADTSQFEQHIRAICGLPLGSTRRVGSKVTMDNLIGDDVDAWPDLLAEPGASLHLYGKGAPRPGRKMGHVTRLRD